MTDNENAGPEEFGFRVLTSQNVLDPDPISSAWVLRNRETGEVFEKTPELWAEEILSVEPGQHVPRQIRREFVLARAPLLYGFFFYPLYALGMGQLFRVSEASVALAAETLLCPASVRNLKGRIDWLSARGTISTQDAQRWHAARYWRNRFAHPGSPGAMLPTWALDELSTSARDIDALFRRVNEERTV